MLFSNKFQKTAAIINRKKYKEIFLVHFTFHSSLMEHPLLYAPFNLST